MKIIIIPVYKSGVFTGWQFSATNPNTEHFITVEEADNEPDALLAFAKWYANDDN